MLKGIKNIMDYFIENLYEIVQVILTLSIIIYVVISLLMPEEHKYQVKIGDKFYLCVPGNAGTKVSVNGVPCNPVKKEAQ